MDKIFTIATTEFKRLFNSPLAWSVLAILQFILTLMFLIFLDAFITDIQPATATMENPPGVTSIVLSPLYLWTGVIMLVIMPIMTMRLFAEERMNKTLTLLLSSPLSSTQIVLGKFLGIVFFILLVIAMISLIPLALTIGTTLDWGVIFTSSLGLFLLLSSFAAAGLFISSLTSQPIIAAISSFGLLLFLVVLYLSGNSQGNSSEVFIYLSHFSHYLPFLDGVFDTSDLVYYALFIVGFLILSIRKLDNDRLLG
ncbi:MAG: ABC transporter permease subunit [Cocleimonas sp.]|nr:ABC transporter permease subunit [Cocleimonas sp.]